ncbi:N(6)-adenine-specific methyltransferase METTL4 [Tribolium castaneum]|uniref:Methyltransferase-like protein 4 n=1 Tax=Tribolium castaneum TaxID=7070 RepID=D6WRX7_TRICA|nr:PREDICTED: methyltransferase-like protein 4 [Tribolium castaneum]EFA06597.2 Methyltransferase-like protein 4 [Tribolium castaneum]|eukprot:XP_008195262.1 PREDICTED: methyltransferase-like protein 4 [Tribolium castaneum]
MSIVKNSKYGWFISHETLIKNAYNNINCSHTNYQLKSNLFNIYTPYKTAKNRKFKHRETSDENTFEREVRCVEELYSLFYGEIKQVFTGHESEVRNDEAVNTATEIYEISGKNLITDLHGCNNEGPTIRTINDARFLFPANCTFYAKNVTDMGQYLEEKKYDLILLDPPWWNKYIRRKRKHSEHAYDMMFNHDLKNLPLENHLKPDGLVAVWCTNSMQHLTALRDEIFPKWGVKFVSKWYWVKVTKSGVPICQFSQPPRKQPFEQIIFAAADSRSLPNPPDGKLVASVPSALHSHKPPLCQLLQDFLPPGPNCLEVFARYLLPDWTSYGREVLRLQHESLYEISE